MNDFIKISTRGVEYDYQEAKTKISSLIAGREAFVITGLSGSMLDASNFVENEIERQGMTCRVYTRNRAYAAGAMAWTGGGLLSLAGIAIHNIATFNPDYEVGRAITENCLYVTYKK